MLFNLVALATLAVVASVAPTPSNALSVESHNFVRNSNAARHHAVLSKRQSTRPRRCRARTGGEAPVESPSSSAAATTSNPHPSSSAPAPAPPSSSAPAPAPPTTSNRPTSSAPPPPPPSSTPRPTSSTPAPAPPAPTWAGSKKACIAYVGDHIRVADMIRDSNKVACIINWSSWKPQWMNQIKNDIVFVPMLWGHKQIGDVQRNVHAGFSNYILGMNEPNQHGQARMSVGDGIGLWKAHIQPLKSQGYTLISPAPTNAPDGLTWLRDFINGCDGCTVDHIATHWYGTDAEQFVGHLQSYRQAFNRPIWVTEYACHDFSGRNQQCNSDKTWAFMDRTQSFMDNTDWVFRYAYFGFLPEDRLGGVDQVNLLIRGNSLTPLGRKYLGI